MLSYLLARLVRDAVAKPIYDDEALAALIAAKPLPEVIETVMVDRGGAPLHFVLAHATLAVDPSPIALRALSIVFALAAVLLCYDLGRRLAGRTAGLVAAVVATSSELLVIYGSFARMYALLVFAAALAFDLFVRALEARTARSAAVAAAAALLLPAAHPYGLIPFAVLAAAALALWRGRPIRPALPTLAITLGVVPFLLADVRLAERFSVGLEGKPLASGQTITAFVGEVLRGLVGGSGAVFLLFVVLALGGLVAAARRLLPFAAVAAALLAAPLLVLLVARTGGTSAPLSPRYFVFLLPVWAVLIGVAVAKLADRSAPVARVVMVAGIAAVALTAPAGAVTDPRVLPAASPDEVAAPAAWVRAHVDERDVLFPFSPVFAAALPEAGEATVVSRARPDLLLRQVDEAALPVRSAFVAVPLSSGQGSVVSADARVHVHRFPSWLVLELDGPFANRAALLEALYRAVASIEPADGFVLKARSSLSAALCAAGEDCP